MGLDIWRKVGCIFIALNFLCVVVLADTPRPSGASVGLFGRPGTLDMPSARAAGDGTLALSYTYAPSFTRNTAFFQYAPWGSISLRYGGNGAVGSSGVRPNYDRSLDLAFNVLPERGMLPSLSFGMQDIIGTGVYAGEYLALGKSSPSGRLYFDVGLGWGRLASHGTMTNPLGKISSDFEVRPKRVFGRGGRPHPEEWFKGPVSPFVGVQLKATENLVLKAEYSSDDYSKSNFKGTLTSASNYNFGVQYAFSKGIIGHISHLQGRELSLGVTLLTNTKQSMASASRTPAPPYVFTGQSGWVTNDYAVSSSAKDKLNAALDRQGLHIVGLSVDRDVAHIAFENRSFDSAAQAFGRMARWLTFALPPEVSTYNLTVVRSGMVITSVKIDRSSLIAAEHALFGPEDLASKSIITTAARALHEFEDITPELQLSWGVSPYTEFTLFDPDDPRRADVGLQLDVHVDNGLGLEASGRFRKRLAGNRKEGRGSNSTIQRVRTEQVLYDQSDNVKIKELYVAKYGRIAPDIYGRLTAGYLEQMYAGFSAEALWAPFERPWSVGVDANYVVQRDYDGLFGLRDYDVFTGHLTGKYTLSDGAYFQISAGQYLAGDKGATLTVGRTFTNGWDLSAYATLTDVPFEMFGEGSFDKGIRLEIPMAALFGTQTRDKHRIGIRSITRDGGARLQVPGQLAEMIEGYTERDLLGSWPRVLR